MATKIASEATWLWRSGVRQRLPQLREHQSATTSGVSVWGQPSLGRALSGFVHGLRATMSPHTPHAGAREAGAGPRGRISPMWDFPAVAGIVVAISARFGSSLGGLLVGHGAHRIPRDHARAQFDHHAEPDHARRPAPPEWPPRSPWAWSEASSRVCHADGPAVRLEDGCPDLLSLTTAASRARPTFPRIQAVTGQAAPRHPTWSSDSPSKSSVEPATLGFASVTSRSTVDIELDGTQRRGCSARLSVSPEELSDRDTPERWSPRFRGALFEGIRLHSRDGAGCRLGRGKRLDPVEGRASPRSRRCEATSRSGAPIFQTARRASRPHLRCHLTHAKVIARPPGEELDALHDQAQRMDRTGAGGVGGYESAGQTRSHRATNQPGRFMATLYLRRRKSTCKCVPWGRPRLLGPACGVWWRTWSPHPWTKPDKGPASKAPPDGNTDVVGVLVLAQLGQPAAEHRTPQPGWLDAISLPFPLRVSSLRRAVAEVVGCVLFLPSWEKRGVYTQNPHFTDRGHRVPRCPSPSSASRWVIP